MSTYQPAAGTTDRECRLTLLALMLAGVVARVAQYLSRRSFWEDESFLVLNLRDKTASELMGRLAHHQAAPPLFLLVERAAAWAWGASELGLRLLPLAAGLASLLLIARVARALAAAGPGRPAANYAVLATVGLFALSDRLIWRASEVKPYGGDALVALVLTATALAGAGRTSASVRLTQTGGAAAGLVWFSFPAVFAFAGLSLALLPAVVRPAAVDPAAGRRLLRGVLIFAACNLLVAASFLVLYVTVARHQQSAELEEFWAEHFADLTRPLAFAKWLALHLYDLCQSACEPLGPVVLPLVVIGTVALARGRRWQVLGALWLPVGVAVAAACVHRYPFDGKRLTTFLVPGVLLLAGIGFGAVAVRLAAVGPRRAVVALGVLLAVPAASCAYSLIVPRTRAHVRPAVEFVAARYQPGDVIYCNPNPFQFLCYWPPAGRPDVAGGPAPRWLPAFPQAGGELAGRRYWVVIAYMPGHERYLPGLLAPARAAGRLLDKFDGHGGAAYLFEAAGAAQSDSPTPGARGGT
ncbi:MAG: hypothetical protein JWO31_3373 [Phycisphaerales bacterium]|nr:hypothetical protein [Phycisphaerales bacterium]